MTDQEKARQDLELMELGNLAIDQGLLDDGQAYWVQSLADHNVGEWIQSEGITGSRSGSNRGRMTSLPEGERQQLKKILIDCGFGDRIAC